MSENNVFEETVNMAQPQGNSYDGSEQAYQEQDQSLNIEEALEEKKQVEDLKDQIKAAESPEREETEQDPELSSKFAALSRKEKALREKEYQIEAKLAELEEKYQAMSQPQEPEENIEPELPLEYRLKKDPLGTLKELGLSYDELTNLALNDGKLTPEMQMDLMRREIDEKYSSEIENLKKELQERDQRLEEEKYNETINNFKLDIRNFVNENDKYELIKANDASDVVYDVIEQHYEKTKRILTKEEAAEQVESYFEEEIEKMLKLNKLQQKLQLKQPEQRQPVKQAPTLSNAHSASASSTNSRRPSTRDESVAAAASLLKWNT